MNRSELKAAIKVIAPSGGRDVRHHLLAYALLRGRAYRRIERTTRAHNEPSPSRIAAVLGADVDTVKAWLAVPVLEQADAVAA